MSYFRPVFLGTGLAACLATFMSCLSLSTPAKPLVYAFHAAPTGTGTLRVRTSELIHRKEPLAVALRAIYQYDPAADAWTRLAGPHATWMVPIPQPRQLYSADTDPVLHTLPPVGLFWVTWEEEGHRHASPAYSGPIMCNDVMLGPAPPGRIPLCVPFADHAEARFVPDPAALPD